MAIQNILSSKYLCIYKTQTQYFPIIEIFSWRNDRNINPKTPRDLEPQNPYITKSRTEPRIGESTFEPPSTKKPYALMISHPPLLIHSKYAQISKFSAALYIATLRILFRKNFVDPPTNRLPNLCVSQRPVLIPHFSTPLYRQRTAFLEPL